MNDRIMKANRLIRIGTLLVLCCILCTCGKEEGDSSDEHVKGSVYGTITYLGTDDPVANALVQLRPRNSIINEDMRQTGYDGYYEFCDVEDGIYAITVSKTGYDDWIGGFDIKIKNGNQLRKDVQIEKKPEVYTYEVTNLISLGYSSWNVINWSATLNGYIASEGSPAYQERGFCYGTSDNIDDYKVAVSGNGTGLFSKEVTGTSTYGYPYYVKAYVKTQEGIFVYGDAITFYPPDGR